MDKQEIITKLETLFRNIFQDDNLIITESLTANDVEKWDSLSHLTMIAEVEKSFGIRFKLKELIGMKNVGDLIDTIQEKRKF